MRTITVVTATRAEYGLLRPVVHLYNSSQQLRYLRKTIHIHYMPNLYMSYLFHH